MEEVQRLWDIERSVLDVLLYRYKNQHRRSDFFRHFQLVCRALRRTNAPFLCSFAGSRSSHEDAAALRCCVGVRLLMATLVRASAPVFAQLRHTYHMPICLSLLSSYSRLYYICKSALCLYLDSLQSYRIQLRAASRASSAPSSSSSSPSTSSTSEVLVYDLLQDLFRTRADVLYLRTVECVPECETLFSADLFAPGSVTTVDARVAPESDKGEWAGFGRGQESLQLARLKGLTSIASAGGAEAGAAGLSGAPKRAHQAVLQAKDDTENSDEDRALDDTSGATKSVKGQVGGAGKGAALLVRHQGGGLLAVVSSSSEDEEEEEEEKEVEKDKKEHNDDTEVETEDDEDEAEEDEKEDDEPPKPPASMKRAPLPATIPSILPSLAAEKRKAGSMSGSSPSSSREPAPKAAVVQKQKERRVADGKQATPTSKVDKPPVLPSVPLTVSFVSPFQTQAPTAIVPSGLSGIGGLSRDKTSTIMPSKKVEVRQSKAAKSEPTVQRSVAQKSGQPPPPPPPPPPPSGKQKQPAPSKSLALLDELFKGLD